MRNPFRRPGSRTRSEHAAGSVPWLLEQSRSLRRQALLMSLPVFYMGALNVLNDDNGWLRAFQLLFVVGYSLLVARTWTRSRELARQAWETETATTIHAMVTSGLYTHPQEVIEAIAEADPPPGMSRRVWRRMNEQALALIELDHPADCPCRTGRTGPSDLDPS